MASDSVPETDPSPDRHGYRERPPGVMRRLAYTLLVLECVVILVPSIYGRLTPKLFGIPFFYWFQLAWIIVAMVVTGIVYLLTTTRETRAPRATGAPRATAAPREASAPRHPRERGALS